MNKIKASLSSIDLSPSFKIAKGAPVDEQALLAYLSQNPDEVTVIVEYMHEDNDYNCQENQPVLFVKLNEDSLVETMDLSL